jgi:hypothetical protein
MMSHSKDTSNKEEKDSSKNVADDSFRKLYEGSMPFFEINGLEEMSEYSFRVKPTNGEYGPTKKLRTLPLLSWDDDFSMRGKCDIKYFFYNMSCVVQSTTDKWKTVLSNTCISSGVFNWQIRIDHTSKGYLFIGVCTRNADSETYVGGDGYGWGFFIYDRSCYHNRIKGKPASKISDSFTSGDILNLSMNCELGTLAYSKNGSKAINKIISNIPSRVLLYPAASLLHKGDVISICDDFSVRNVPITAKDSALSSPTDSEKYEEIQRYFGICSKFAKSVLHYDAYDPFLLARAYFGWNSWMKSNTKIFRFGIGNLIEVDISDEVCSLYGVYPGQKLVSPLGDGQILGLDSISKKIIIKFNGKDSHEFCDKLRLESFKLKECEKLSEFEEKWRSLKNIRKECADLSFENFMKLANSHKNFDIDKLIVQQSNLLSSNTYVFYFFASNIYLMQF